MEAEYNNILNTYQCYYCECRTIPWLFNPEEHPNCRTREHIVPHSLLKNLTHKVFFNTSTCCVYCNTLHSKILCHILDVNRILIQISSMEPKKKRNKKWDDFHTHTGIKSRINTIKKKLQIIKELLSELNLFTPHLKNYNPCINYIACIKDVHPNLLKYVGDLQLNGQSYINVPV